MYAQSHSTETQSTHLRERALWKWKERKRKSENDIKSWKEQKIYNIKVSLLSETRYYTTIPEEVFKMHIS